MPPKVNSAANKYGIKSRQLRESNGGKERALIETLHEEETRQLESFIKTRSQDLDNEIKSLNQKFGTRTSSIENDSLQFTSSTQNLSVRGAGMGKIEFNMEKMRRFDESQGKDELKISMEPYSRQLSAYSNGSHNDVELLFSKIRISKQSLHFVKLDIS